MWLRSMCTGLVAIGVLSGCGSPDGLSPTSEREPSNKTHITRTDFPGRWPFTVDVGVLSCDSAHAQSVTFTPDGDSTIYAINGTAKGWAEPMGWSKDLERIWRPLVEDPDPSDPLTEVFEGVRVSIGDVISAGLALCGQESTGH